MHIVSLHENYSETPVKLEDEVVHIFFLDLATLIIVKSMKINRAFKGDTLVLMSQ